MTSRSRKFLIPAAIFLLMFVALSIAKRGFALTDTFDLLNGTGWSAHCISAGTWDGCGYQVGQFALLQYLPALVFHTVGFSYMGAFSGLVALNGLAVLGVFVLVGVCVKRFTNAATTSMAVVVLAVSPFAWYAHAGYGEPLATFATTAFTVALLLRWHPAWIGLAAAFAGISKETAFPFLAALAVAVWLIQRRRPGRAELIAVGAGLVFAVLLNSAFNVFRYGEIDNAAYTPAVYRVPLGQAANNFAALLLSPTGGLFWLWPAFIAILCATAAIAFRRRRVFEPGILIAAIFVGLLVVFALWYAPLGGTAWGPRLLLPWLPALIVLCICAYPAESKTFVRRIIGGPRREVWLLALLLLVTGLPNVIAMVDSSRRFHAPPGVVADLREVTVRAYSLDATCPTFPRIEASRHYYYRCLRHDLWNRGLTPVYAYEQLKQPLVVGFATMWCLAVVGLLGAARTEVRRQLPARA